MPTVEKPRLVLAGGANGITLNQVIALYHSLTGKAVSAEEEARLKARIAKSHGNNGRMLVESVRKSPEAPSGDNCGTGAGGFQPGNTCADEDGVPNAPSGSGGGFAPSTGSGGGEKERHATTPQEPPTGSFKHNALSREVEAVERSYPPVNPQGKESRDRHRSEDGTWSPERQALHDDIVKHIRGHVPVTPKGQRTYLMMGGGTAAGKSSLLKTGVVDLPPNRVPIDSDEIKRMLPEAKAMLKADDDRWAGYTHEESSYLAKRVQAESFAFGQNVVLDGTGNNRYESVADKVAKAKAAGYKAQAEYVTASFEEVFFREARRADQTGRKVAPTFVWKSHSGVSVVLPRALQEGLFDQVRLWDNEFPQPDGKPTLVAEGKGKNFKIHNQKLWDSFVAKSSVSFEQAEKLAAEAEAKWERMKAEQQGAAKSLRKSASDNCGTGDGGFKEGNTCAAEDSAGLATETPDKPKRESAKVQSRLETLGFKRTELPQIASDDKVEFLDFLKNSKGAGYKEQSIKARYLKGVQVEYSPDKVEQMVRHLEEHGCFAPGKCDSDGEVKLKNRIIVSKDNFILDGHHRWRAEYEHDPDALMDVVKVDLPIGELLEATFEFPKHFIADTSEDKGPRKRKTVSKSAGDNCGTGAGGFQPGNDCAAEDGVSSDGGSDSSGHSTKKVNIVAKEGIASVEAITNRLLGIEKPPETLYANLAGVPEDSSAEVTVIPVDWSHSPWEPIEGIQISTQGEGWKTTRHVLRNGGYLVMQNDGFHIDPKLQGKGFGTRAFAKQVETAVELGLDKITLAAVRSKSENGYYTWARLGFDADLSMIGSNAVVSRLRKAVPNAERVSDLMRTPEGRAAWKQHGESVLMEFDLSEGSLSRRILSAYLEERAKR